MDFADRVVPECGQDIEPQGLTAKIFKNKDFASSSGCVAENLLGEPSRAWDEFALFLFLSKGCSSQKIGFFLWKVVKNRCWRRGGQPPCPNQDFQYAYFVAARKRYE
jgi:hypothetical protein